MRVIAGEAKGRKLLTLADPGLRPSGDKVKGALFSSLGPTVVGARVLDLYAGSGALGIEALSRGAASCVFVESDPAACQVIRQNLSATRLEGRAEVLNLTSEAFASRPAEEAADIVVMDPPYAVGVPAEVLGSLRRNGHIHDGSRLAVEVSSRIMPFEGLEGFSVVKQKRYGSSGLVHMVVLQEDGWR